MAKPFIHHLHIIHGELNYTYIHIYNLEAYLQLKTIKIVITNKTPLNENWGLAPINLNNALLKLDKEVLSWIFLGRLFQRFKPHTLKLW